jgi:mediator of RNA polymerase II transcription subunit 12
MRVEFKRLAIRIDAGGEDGSDARKSLNELVHATLDRECTADDTDLLCEAFRGMESVVAEEVCALLIVGVSGLTPDP